MITMVGTTKVTDSTFDSIVNDNELVLLDFWAPWCGPCRMIGPVLEELAKDYKGKLVVGKLNVDDNPATSMKFGVRSIPTLLIIKGGNQVDRIVGFQSKDQLAGKIEKYI